MSLLSSFLSVLLFLFLLQIVIGGTTCPTDIVLHHQDGEVANGNVPSIEIVSQDSITTTFRVRKHWMNDTVKLQHTYVKFKSVAHGDYSCVSSTPDFAILAGNDDDEELELTAFCFGGNSPISVVSIWVSDSTFNPSTNKAEVDACCHVDESDTYPKVQYNFIIHCESTCDYVSNTTSTDALPFPFGSDLVGDTVIRLNSNETSAEAPSPFGGLLGDVIRLESTTCEESVIITQEPHIGTEGDEDIELTVHITDTQIYDSGSGYQPQVVLFLAKPDATLDTVTTDDDGWPYFESQVVSWMKGKIHACMSTTFFSASTLAGDSDNHVRQQATEDIRMETNVAMRIRRSNGQMTYWYSFDSVNTWEQIGVAMDLPHEYRKSPLKIGYRIKREWQCEYNIGTIPYLLSGGPVEYDTGRQTLTSYYLEKKNSIVSNSVSFEKNIVTFSSGNNGALGNQQSILLSEQTFQDDVSLQLQLTDRQIFGKSRYQGGIWLFFVPESISDVGSFDLHENSWKSFIESTLGAVGDKVFSGDNIFNKLSHTWFNTHAIQLDGSMFDGDGSDTYMNIAGFLRLERHQGFIQAFNSLNGDGWKSIGELVELPEEWKYANLRVGICIKTNWNLHYHISFMATIDTYTVDRSRIDEYSSPTSAPTPAYTEGSGGVAIGGGGGSGSYFDTTNSLSTNVVALDHDSVRFSSFLGTEHALLLSHLTFTGSITLTIDISYRQLFGNGYQGGIWLFFADPTVHVETLFAKDGPCDWNQFKNSTVAAIGDKLHSSIDHTWITTHTLSSSNDNKNVIEHHGGIPSWRNMEGSLRLERNIDGFVSTSIRQTHTSTWDVIGNSVELPDEWKTKPLKIGIAWRENYNANYQIEFTTSVDGTPVDVVPDTNTRRGLRGLQLLVPPDVVPTLNSHRGDLGLRGIIKTSSTSTTTTMAL